MIFDDISPTDILYVMIIEMFILYIGYDVFSGKSHVKNMNANA